MCAKSCAWKVENSTKQKLERSEMALAAVNCHSSPAGAGRKIGRVASFRAAALAMPARKSASLLASREHAPRDPAKFSAAMSLVQDCDWGRASHLSGPPSMA